MTRARAATAAFLAHMAASFGLLAPGAQWAAPLMIGAIAAVAARTDWKRTAVGTAIGLAVGLLVASPAFLASPAAGIGAFLGSRALFLLLASAFSAFSAYALEHAGRRERVERIAAIAIVLAIVGALWVTTGVLNADSRADSKESLNHALSKRQSLGHVKQDHEYYTRIFYDLHDGKPYYGSYVAIFLSDPDWSQLPVGVTGYRLPTLFYLWRLLPPDAAYIPRMFLLFATLAVASAFSIGAQLSRPGIAVLSALIVAEAYLLLATTTWVTFVDGWGMAVTLASIALFIAAVRKESRGLLWAAVSVAVAAATLRELLVYPMVLAAASALALPKGRRWREVWPWLVGLGCFGAVYATHVIAIAGRVNHAVGYEFWLQGGLAHALATVQFFSEPFGGNSWFVPLLALAGLAGAIVVRGEQARLSAFLTATIAGPLAGFVIFGNGGRELTSGEPSGYWGMLVVPIALALVPVALARALPFAEAPDRA